MSDGDGPRKFLNVVWIHRQSGARKISIDGQGRQYTPACHSRIKTKIAKLPVHSLIFQPPHKPPQSKSCHSSDTFFYCVCHIGVYYFISSYFVKFLYESATFGTPGFKDGSNNNEWGFGETSKKMSGERGSESRKKKLSGLYWRYMAYNFTELKNGIEETKKWLVEELGSLRTGRATPALLDSVSLEVYGSRMKLNQIATVGVEDARSLYVSPWDAAHIKAIEKAITVVDLGVSVGSDEKGVRVSFPELTTERRHQLVKVLKAKLEEARIAVRQKRTDAMSAIEKSQKAGDMGEDEARRSKDEAQKIVDTGNKALEETADKKEKELQA